MGLQSPRFRPRINEKWAQNHRESGQNHRESCQNQRKSGQNHRESCQDQRDRFEAKIEHLILYFVYNELATKSIFLFSEN